VNSERFPIISGKSQDGLVSRFLNRPISQAITGVLLKFPITPSMWTLSIFPLLIIAFPLLLRGDRFGFICGTAIFQIYSILDGCDGEIARAKKLASDRGQRLDTFCDNVGNLLLVIGIGLGLQRHVPGSFYATEGVLTALLISTNEVFLHGSKTASAQLRPELYPRHQELVQYSGLLFLGERAVWWLIQLTKRDVAILFFFFLALIGLPQWILHLSIGVAIATLFLTCVARVRS
jgi:CDP-L-myo-inositol myo-inositolphosphotransferase